MIEFFQALAIRLAWLRWIAVLIGVGFGALFAFAALSDNAPDSFFTSGLAGLTWGLLLFTFLSVFPHAPAPPGEEHSAWQRFRIQLRRLGYGALGLATLCITLAVIALTFKLL